MKNKTLRRKTAAHQKPAKKSKIPLFILLLCAILSVAALFSFSQSVDPPRISDSNLDFAIAEAIDAARQDVVEAPRSSESWGKLGMVFLAHGFNGPAAESLVNAQRIDDKNPMWFYLHAKAVGETEPKRAIELLEKSVALCGNSPNVPRLSLVELLLSEQKLDQAEHHLREFLGSDQENVRAQHALARLFFMQGEFQRCKDTIIEMHHEIRNRYTMLKNRAESLARQGKANDATIQIKKANQDLSLDLCKQRTIGELLANAMNRLGESEAAEKQLRLAETHPDRSWPDPFTSQVVKLRTGLKTMLNRSDRAFGSGDFAQSAKILKAAIQAYPDSLFAYIHMGRVHIRLGRNAFTQNELAKSKEHYAVAEKHLEKALELDPNSVEALFRLGVVYADQADNEGDPSKFKKAESLYRRAIEIKPDFTMAYYNLSNSLDRQNRVPQAIEALKNVLRLEPNRVDACYILGTMLVRTGSLAEAKEYLRKTAELDPQHSAAREALRKLERTKNSP